jgi:2-C-methyl-D-erythritol 4-phosphate cytidylyltransferase
MTNVLVLTAAGNSTRMGGSVKKEYLPLKSCTDGTVSVLSSALHSFLATGLFKYILITVPAEGEGEARRVLAEDRRISALLAMEGPRLIFAEGGATRQSSVRNGLAALGKALEADGESGQVTVLIHDGARPWVSGETIQAVLEGVRLHGASVPALASVDTQKETDSSGRIVRHLDRSRIVSVQTPQGFLLSPLLAAHAQAADDGHTYTDDTEIWGRYAGDVHICEGDRANRKITYQGDI